MSNVAPIAALITLALAGGLTLVWPEQTRQVVSAPQATPSVSAASDAAIITGAIEPAATPVDGKDIEAVLAVLSAIDSSDITAARAQRDALVEGSDDRNLATWLVAMSGHRDIPVSELTTALETLAEWPGRETISAHLERRLADGWFAASSLSRTLGEKPPQTIEAALVLATAAKAGGKPTEARALLAPFWHRSVLDASVETRILAEFADVLTTDDHRARYFSMMVRERIRAGERVRDAAGMTGLHDAWAAVIRGARDTDTQIAAIPAELLASEAGVFLRVENLRKSNRVAEAAKLLAGAPSSSSNPDAWWVERRIVSRLMREAGEPAIAYALASAQTEGTVETRAEALFHAGWYALRNLEKPDVALPHFREMARIVTGPASKARAAYWTGRTLDALGNTEGAKGAYTEAAAHPTTFHGQLAAAALGSERLIIPAPVADADASLELRADPVFRAIVLLSRAGVPQKAAPLYLGLADRLVRPQTVAALVDHARMSGDERLALRIAKSAAWNGVVTGLTGFPDDAIDGLETLAPDSRLLALAVARQESEFNVSAVSRADARGLLQLLPSTAKAVAGRLDVPYSPERLTSEPAFNALLGTAYLGEQIERFDNSLVLTFVAYNAGPGRAREWIARYGNPVGLPLDEAIDWIEQIPYPETQGYVMKVLENLTVYRAAAGQPLTIERDITGR